MSYFTASFASLITFIFFWPYKLLKHFPALTCRQNIFTSSEFGKKFCQIRLKWFNIFLDLHSKMKSLTKKLKFNHILSNVWTFLKVFLWRSVIYFCKRIVFGGCHDFHLNDTQHNDIQHCNKWIATLSIMTLGIITLLWLSFVIPSVIYT